MSDLIIIIYVGAAGVVFGLLMLLFNKSKSTAQKDFAFGFIGCGAFFIVLSGGFWLEFFLMQRFGL
jgi:NADH:ubiquinone oxidoreductase subunit 6 (subunit J)